LRFALRLSFRATPRDLHFLLLLLCAVILSAAKNLSTLLLLPVNLLLPFLLFDGVIPKRTAPGKGAQKKSATRLGSR
jgi:hypothetical protein